MSRGSKKTGPGSLMSQVGNRARTAGWDANPSPQLELGAPPLPEYKDQDVCQQQVSPLRQGLLNSKGCNCTKISSIEPVVRKAKSQTMLASQVCELTLDTRAYMCCVRGEQVLDRIALL